MKNIKGFSEFVELNEQMLSALMMQQLMGVSVEEEGIPEPNLVPADSPSGKGSPKVPIENVNTSEMDKYGAKVGITDKGDSAKLEQPSSGPIGNIVNSAYANLNVPTRKIPGTGEGNLGCAAAVSIIFYRATGYGIAGNGAITLGTGSLYSKLSKESESSNGSWQKITDWKNAKPGDIIVTARGSKAGHTGVVVEGGNIISNSSGGFKGDKKGQIEMNYNLNSWDSVASRNPSQTSAFRYVGPYKSNWGSASPQIA